MPHAADPKWNPPTKGRTGRVTKTKPTYAVASNTAAPDTAGKKESNYPGASLFSSFCVLHRCTKVRNYPQTL